MDERDLVKFYASVLQARGFWTVEEYNIYAGLGRDASLRYRYGVGYKGLEHPPHLGQPTIDLLYGPLKGGRRHTPIYACEFKYIRSSRGLSYYAGLDEALALLTYGVDKVKLIHLIDRKAWRDDRIKTYPDAMFILITLLRLPIGFETYLVDETGIFQELEETWIEPPQNPLLEEDFVKKTRKFIIKDLALSGE